MSAPAAARPGGDRTPAPPFVASLRTRPQLLRLGSGAEPTVTVRVEMPEVWDAVRVETPLSEPVRVVKERALQALYPGAGFPEEFVMKLRGVEVRDETASLAGVGATNGSIFLLTYRRRRPVRT